MTPAVRATLHRWRLPLILVRGGGPFEGAAVLEEISGPLGMLLFHLVRDVDLWIATPPEQRAGLFVPRAWREFGAMIREARPDRQLKTALQAVASVLEAPEAAQDEQVALACRKVACWADEHELPRTSIAFTQAAALMTPADAALSYAAGRLAWHQAQIARAEMWFRRAIVLAARSGDWSTYSQAWIAMGRLYRQRGNLPAARRFLIRALRAARRTRQHQVAGRALHELFVVDIYAGCHKEAQSLSRLAFEAYGEQHPALPGFAHDVAWWWIECGHFQPALTVFHALVRNLQRDEERLRAQASLVRAAAGAGERQLFEQTWDEVWDHMSRMESMWAAATVMLDLAQGAAMLGEYERAVRAAERAVQVARKSGEAQVLLEAESLLDQARRARTADPAAAAPAESPKPEHDEETETLAKDLARALDAAPEAR